jgi:hypothetical protein
LVVLGGAARIPDDLGFHRDSPLASARNDPTTQAVPVIAVTVSVMPQGPNAHHGRLGWIEWD